MGEEMTQDEIDSMLSQMASGIGGSSSPTTTAEASSGELSQNDIDALMNTESQSPPPAPKAAAPAKSAPAESRARPVQFASLGDGETYAGRNDIGMLLDVPMELTVELGRTNMYIRDILDLGPGSVIEINRLAGEPIELLVNGKVIAKGEVVVIDEKFGLRIIELLNPINESRKN